MVPVRSLLLDMEGKVLNEESASISWQIPQADYHARRPQCWGIDVESTFLAETSTFIPISSLFWATPHFK